MQRAKADSACSQEIDIIKAQSFVDLMSYIEDSVEVGNFVFKLADLYNFFQGRLTDSGVDITTNKTRLKLWILDHFSGQCQEQSYSSH